MEHAIVFFFPLILPNIFVWSFFPPSSLPSNHFFYLVACCLHSFLPICVPSRPVNSLFHLRKQKQKNKTHLMKIKLKEGRKKKNSRFRCWNWRRQAASISLFFSLCLERSFVLAASKKICPVTWLWGAMRCRVLRVFGVWQLSKKKKEKKNTQHKQKDK